MMHLVTGRAKHVPEFVMHAVVLRVVLKTANGIELIRD
jgi:hypothetical protein